MKQTCMMKLTVDSLELTVTPEQAQQLYNQLQKELEREPEKAETVSYHQFTDIEKVWNYLENRKIVEYYPNYGGNISRTEEGWSSTKLHFSNLSPELLKSVLAHNKLLLLSQFFRTIVANTNGHWYYIISAINKPVKREIMCHNTLNPAYCPFPTIEVAKFVLQHYKQLFDDYFMFVVPESSSSEKS